MFKSVFISVEYRNDQTIELVDILSLSAYNNGKTTAIINNQPLNPGESVVIFPPDFTTTVANIDLYFEPLPVEGVARPQGNNLQPYAPSTTPGITPAVIAPEVRKTIILNIKKLKQE